MGFRERLSKANWELNTLLKTGKINNSYYSQKLNISTHDRNTNQASQRIPPNYSNFTPQYNQNTTQAPQIHPTEQIRCPSCGIYISRMAKYCHKCGGIL